MMNWLSQSAFNRPSKFVYSLPYGLAVDTQYPSPLRNSERLSVKVKETFLAFPRWLIQHSINRPAMLDSIANGGYRNPSTPRPLRYGKALPVKFVANIIPTVVALLPHCGPSAILRKIPDRIIDSINAVFWTRFSAHVGIKVFKLKPTVADFYASSTIVLIGIALRVQASIFNVLPTAKFRRLGHSVGNVSFSRKVYNFISHIATRFSSLIRWRPVSAGRTPIIAQADI